MSLWRIHYKNKVYTDLIINIIIIFIKYNLNQHKSKTCINFTINKLQTIKATLNRYAYMGAPAQCIKDALYAK